MRTPLRDLNRVTVTIMAYLGKFPKMANLFEASGVFVFIMNGVLFGAIGQNFVDLLLGVFHIIARVYFPQHALDGALSSHLYFVSEHLASHDFNVEVRRIPSESQRGGNEMLIIKRI